MSMAMRQAIASFNACAARYCLKPSPETKTDLRIAWAALVTRWEVEEVT